MGGRGLAAVFVRSSIIHNLSYREKGNKGLTGMEWVSKSEEMGEGTEIRMGLLRMRRSHEWFADRCGMCVKELKEMLETGDIGDGVRGEYAALLLEGEEEKPVGKPLVEVFAEEEEAEEEKAQKQGKEIEHKGCVFGRPVRNAVMQLIVFSDGSEGMARKKRDFKPKAGLPCEVETSDEEGLLNLVGRYRNNGVRLD